MKKIQSLLWLLLLNLNLFGQNTQYVGLSNKHITSLKINYGIISVGTKYNGVYWQNFYDVTDTGWSKIKIDSINVTAVYPHKSGPLGWAIGIGAEPTDSIQGYIFCSFIGGNLRPLSYGIDTSQTPAIVSIDGFPDPTICGETFAIGGRKLYRRYFQDTVWHSVFSLSFEGDFHCLKAREDNQYVYAGGAEGFSGILLIRSSDKGDSWENLSPGCYVYDLDFFGQTTHSIIVTDRIKIMMSMDSGNNWFQIFQTDSLLIQKISYDSDGKNIYAITNTLYYDFPRTYLFVSSDNGSTWESKKLDINDIIVDMDIGNDNSIYIASISSGVFKLDLPILSIKIDNNILVKNFALFQNYPNPFNPTTKIKYTIPSVETRHTSSVQLKVYNILGCEIETLVNKEQSPGEYEVEFEADKYNLSSGVYFYQLNTGGFKSTKKMILLR